MGIILLLLPASIVLAAIALAAYVWATKSGQFEDLDTPPQRMLHDDETDQE